MSVDTNDLGASVCAELHSQIQPFTSGYRWVLTYNLIQEVPPTPDTTADENIRGVFADLQHSCPDPKMVYLLEHQSLDLFQEISTSRRQVTS